MYCSFPSLLLRFSVLVLLLSCETNSTTLSNNTPVSVPLSGSVLPQTLLLETPDGVAVQNGGYGSGASAHPVTKDEFYAITDRGATINTTEGIIFADASYTPKIGHFKLNKDASITLLKEIILKSPSGTPSSGRLNPDGKGATGELAYNTKKQLLDTDHYGLDPEAIVAMLDGSFWIADEYGPHIVHLDQNGVELERISPIGVATGLKRLPAVFKRRKPNRSMEGLTSTLNQRTLVAIMESTLDNPSKNLVSNHTLTRILTFEIATGKTKQYLYKQEKASNRNTEIVALSNTEFLVIEQDDAFATEDPLAQKHIYKIDISHATDVSGNAFYSKDGMLVKGKTLENCSWAELAQHDIQPVKKSLMVDLTMAIPGYKHDKAQGLWLMGGNMLGVINDDDFSITNKNDKIAEKKIPNTTIIDKSTLYTMSF